MTRRHVCSSIGFGLPRRWVGAFLLAVTLSCLPHAASAEGPGWSANSTVKKLVVTADGGVNVLLFPYLTACVSNSGYGPAYASIYPSHPGINRIKASLMTAYVTGQSVALYFSDNTCRVTEIMLGGW